MQTHPILLLRSSVHSVFLLLALALEIASDVVGDSIELVIVQVDGQLKVDVPHIVLAGRRHWNLSEGEADVARFVSFISGGPVRLGRPEYFVKHGMDKFRGGDDLSLAHLTSFRNVMQHHRRGNLNEGLELAENDILDICRAVVDTEPIPGSPLCTRHHWLSSKIRDGTKLEATYPVAISNKSKLEVACSVSHRDVVPKPRMEKFRDQDRWLRIGLPQSFQSPRS